MNAESDNNDIGLDAGEYVLGTLDDVTRARIERDMIFNADLREQVRQWEERLQPMADQIEPVQPPAASWETIRARTIGKARKNTLGKRLAWWKTLALGGVAASLAMAVVLTDSLKTRTPSAPGQVAQAEASAHPAALAVVNDQKKDPMWVVQCYQQPPRVMVSVVPDEIPIKDKSLQLWALTKEGNAMFVGVVPTSGKREISIDPEMIEHLDDVKAFAVSVEPMTGSPTNQPSGPIHYSGGLVRL